MLSAVTVAQLEAEPWSYDHPGVTRSGIGHGSLRLARSVQVGLGPQTWDRLRAGLMSWQVHGDAGLGVAASSPVVHEAAVVVLRFGTRWAHLNAPCRVVYVVDEPARCGFAYGTLPGHPEAGEESFILSRSSDGRVTFSVVASSRPASLIARCGGPVTRRIQHVVVGRYLDAARRLADGRDTTAPDLRGPWSSEALRGLDP